MLVRLLLVGVLALLPSVAVRAEPGDWPAFKSGPERTSFNPDETALGVANLPSVGEKWRLALDDDAWPVVVEDVLYVASPDHVSAYQTSDARRIWRRTLKRPASAVPLVDKGVVYVTLSGGAVTAIDAKSGKTKWLSKTASFQDDLTTSSPAISGKLVYVGGADGKLYALKAKTGKVAFTAKTGKFAIAGSPAVSEGVVYVPGSDGKLYAFNAKTGKTVWSTKVGSRFEQTPAVSDGKAFFGYAGSLYALDAKTGKQAWKKAVGGGAVSTPAVAGGKVVVTSDNAFAVDAATGDILWEGFTAASEVGPAIANGVVYTQNSFGRFAAFNLSTGAPLTAIVTGAGIPDLQNTPVVSNGAFYLVGRDAIIAYSAE